TSGGFSPRFLSSFSLVRPLALRLDLTFWFREQSSPGDDDRKAPDCSEDAYQQETNEAEVVVQYRHRIPEPAGEIQMLAREAKDFDAADADRCNDGHGGNDDVVVDAAHGIIQSPVIDVEHENVVGRINRGHSSGEQDWEQ